jgi:hypothetical protein
MPRVADYSIISDSWVVEANQDTIDFEVPSNIDKGSRTILGFMFQAHHLDDMNVELRINGTKVWSWTWSGDAKRVGYFQEVVAKGLVEPGGNTLNFGSDSDEVTFFQLSDIVLWWQANI